MPRRGQNQRLQLRNTAADAASQADALAASLQARVQAVTEKLMSISSSFTVFYELDGSDPAKPWTAGAGTFLSQLIGMAGGSNVGDRLQGDYAQMSQEELLVANPMVILLGDAAYGVTAEVDPVAQAMKSLSEGAACHEKQIALLWSAIEKLSIQGHVEDCVPCESERPQAFEKDKIDQIMGK